jgi:hypothetical protein
MPLALARPASIIVGMICRNRPVLLLILAGVIAAFEVPGTACCDEPADLNRLLDRIVRAAGGAERLRAVKAVRCFVRGTYFVEDTRTTVTAACLLEPPNHARLDVTFGWPPGTPGVDPAGKWHRGISVFSGSAGTSLRVDIEDNAPLTPVAVADFNSWLERLQCCYLPITLKTKGNRLMFLGNRSLHGRDTVAIRLSSSNGPIDLFYDRLSCDLLCCKSREQVLLSLEPLEVECQFSDHKTIDGLRLPMSTETRRGDLLVKSFKLEKLELLTRAPDPRNFTDISFTQK